jgi:hypothetical protein
MTYISVTDFIWCIDGFWGLHAPPPKKIQAGSGSVTRVLVYGEWWITVPSVSTEYIMHKLGNFSTL